MGALELLFVPKCVFCRRVLDNGSICRECESEIQYCGKVTGGVELCSGCVSAFYFRDKARQAILRFKFGRRRSYAKQFAHMMAEALKKEEVTGFDTVTWVPVSARQKRKRGYDQSQLLAKKMAAELCMPAVKTLTKDRGVKQQSRITGTAQRRANVLGAFHMAKGADVRGKSVLLTDDVVTTGATLSECAKVLLLAGAKEVFCVTLASAKRK